LQARESSAGQDEPAKIKGTWQRRLEAIDKAERKDDRERGERYVDEENPTPVCVRGDEAANHRPQHRTHEARNDHEAHRVHQPIPGKGAHQDEPSDGSHERPTQPLGKAAEDQHRRASAEPADH
jgi:hypothetical protein